MSSLITIRSGFLVLMAILLLPLDGQAQTPLDSQAEAILRSRSATQDIVSGKIVSIDDNRLDVAVGDEVRGLMLNPQTIIEIEGKPARLSDFPPSAKVKVLMDAEHPGVIRRLMLSGETPAAVVPTGPAVVVPATPGPVVSPTTPGEVIEPAVPATSVAPTPAITPALPNAMQTPTERTAEINESKSLPVVMTDVVSAVPLDAGFATTTNGVQVESVVPNGWAAQTGFLLGDLVKQVAGQNVVTVQGFYRVLHHYPPGTQVPILIARDNEPVTLQLTLPMNFKPELLGQQSSPQKAPVIRDATIVTSTQLGWVLGMRNGMVTLVSVDPTGPAGISGFQAGDEIATVETHAVQTPAEVMDWIQRFNQNTSVTMTIHRGNVQLTRGLIFPTATTAESAAGSPAPGGTVLDNTLQSLLRTQAEQARRIQDLQAQVDQLMQAVQQLSQGTR
jgi:hypothetical protein